MISTIPVSIDCTFLCVHVYVFICILLYFGFGKHTPIIRSLLQNVNKVLEIILSKRGKVVFFSYRKIMDSEPSLCLDWVNIENKEINKKIFLLLLKLFLFDDMFDGWLIEKVFTKIE